MLFKMWQVYFYTCGITKVCVFLFYIAHCYGCSLRQLPPPEHKQLCSPAEVTVRGICSRPIRSGGVTSTVCAAPVTFFLNTSQFYFQDNRKPQPCSLEPHSLHRLLFLPFCTKFLPFRQTQKRFALYLYQ